MAYYDTEWFERPKMISVLQGRPRLLAISFIIHNYLDCIHRSWTWTRLLFFICRIY